jgi:hypothetical protein
MNIDKAACNLITEAITSEASLVSIRRQWVAPTLQRLEDSSIENGSQNAAESQNGILS